MVVKMIGDDENVQPDIGNLWDIRIYSRTNWFHDII